MEKSRPSLFESFNLQDSDSSNGKASPTPLKQINWKLSNLTKGVVCNGEAPAVKPVKECIVIDDDSNSGHGTPAPVPNAGQSVKSTNKNQKSRPRDDAVQSKSSRKESGDQASGSFSNMRKLTQGKIDGFFQKSPPPVSRSESEGHSAHSEKSADGSHRERALNGQVGGTVSERKSDTEKSKSDKSRHHDSGHVGHQKTDKSRSHSSSKRHHSDKSHKSHEKQSSSHKHGHHRHKSTGGHPNAGHANQSKKSEGKDLRTFNMFEVTTMSQAKRLKSVGQDTDKVSSEKKSQVSSVSSEKLAIKSTTPKKDAIRVSSSSGDKAVKSTTPRKDNDKKDKIGTSSSGEKLEKSMKLTTPNKDNVHNKDAKGSSKSHEKHSHHKSSDSRHHGSKSSEKKHRTPDKHHRTPDKHHHSKTSKSSHSTPEKDKTPSKSTSRSENEKTPSKSRPHSEKDRVQSAEKCSAGSEKDTGVVKSVEKLRPKNEKDGLKSEHKSSPQIVEMVKSAEKQCTGMQIEKETIKLVKEHSPQNDIDLVKSAEKSPPPVHDVEVKKDQKIEPRRPSSGPLVTPEMIYSQVYGADVATPKVSKLQKHDTSSKIKNVPKLAEKVCKTPSNSKSDNIPKKVQHVQENRMHDYWTPKKSEPDIEDTSPDSPKQVVGKTFYKSDTGRNRNESSSYWDRKSQKRTDPSDEKMSQKILDMLMESDDSKSVSCDSTQKEAGEASNDAVELSDKKEGVSRKEKASKDNIFASLREVAMVKEPSDDSRDSVNKSETISGFDLGMQSEKKGDIVAESAKESVDHLSQDSADQGCRPNKPSGVRKVEAPISHSLSDRHTEAEKVENREMNSETITENGSSLLNELGVELVEIPQKSDSPSDLADKVDTLADDEFVDTNEQETVDIPEVSASGSEQPIKADGDIESQVDEDKSGSGEISIIDEDPASVASVSEGCTPPEPDIVSLGGSSVFDDTASTCVRMDYTSEMDYETYLTMISDTSELGERDDKSSVSGFSIATTTSADVSRSKFMRDVSHTEKVAAKAFSKIMQKDENEVESVSRSESPDLSVEHEECKNVEMDEDTEAAAAVSLGQVILVDDDTVPFGDDDEPVGQACELMTSFSSFKDLSANPDDNSLDLQLSEASLDSDSGGLQVSATIENVSFPLVRVGASPEQFAVSCENDYFQQMPENQTELVNENKPLDRSSESIIVSCVIGDSEVEACVEDVDLVCVQGEEGPVLIVEETEKSMTMTESCSASVGGDSALASVIEEEEYDAESVESVDDLLLAIDDVLNEKGGEESVAVSPETIDDKDDLVLVGYPSDQQSESSEQEIESVPSEKAESLSSASVVTPVPSSFGDKEQTGSCPSIAESPIPSESKSEEPALSESGSISAKSEQKPKAPELDTDMSKKESSKANETDKRSSESESSSEEEEVTPRVTRSKARSSDSQSEFSSPTLRTLKLRSYKAPVDSKSPTVGKIVPKESPRNRTNVPLFLKDTVRMKKPPDVLPVPKDGSGVKKPPIKCIVPKDGLDSESETNLPLKDSSFTESQGDLTTSASEGELVRKSSRKRKVKSLGDDILVFAEAGAMKSNFYPKAQEHLPKKVSASETDSANQSPSVTKEKDSANSKPAKTLQATKVHSTEASDKVKGKKSEKIHTTEKDSSDEANRTLRSTAKTDMNSPVRALRSGIVSSPEKSKEPRKSTCITVFKRVAGKENASISKKRLSLASKIARRASTGDEKKVRTKSCDGKGKKSPVGLKSAIKLSIKRSRSKDSNRKPGEPIVKRSRGRPKKCEVVVKKDKPKPKKDVMKAQKSGSSVSDESEENDVEDEDQDYATESESDSEQESESESEAASEDSGSSDNDSFSRSRKRRGGKHSYLKDDDYRPANIAGGGRRRGRPRKRVFEPSDSERDSSEEFQSPVRTPRHSFSRRLKALSPISKVAKPARTDALTVAEVAAARRKAEKEQIKNRHRNLVKKAISTQNQNKLKMKPFRRKQMRAIIVGERKRLERGAKNRVTMYYSDGMEDMRSDDGDHQYSSSSDSEDYLKDIYNLFGTDDADGNVLEGSDQEVDSSILQNPLNIPYYPELREAALSGEQNNNCLLVFNDDTHWNDVAEEMPDKCSSICAKFTGAVVTSIQYQFRDDECSGCESDEPEPKRTKKSKKENVSSPSSRLRLKKKSLRGESKSQKSLMRSSRNPSKLVPTKTIVLELDDVMKKKSPMDINASESLSSSDNKTSVSGESKKTDSGAVVVLDSDTSPSPKKKDLLKERKGVLGLYEEFMSMLHTDEKQDDDVICLDDEPEGQGQSGSNNLDKTQGKVGNSGQCGGKGQAGQIRDGALLSEPEAMDCDNRSSGYDASQVAGKRPGAKTAKVLENNLKDSPIKLIRSCDSQKRENNNSRESLVKVTVSQNDMTKSSKQCDCEKNLCNCKMAESVCEGSTTSSTCSTSSSRTTTPAPDNVQGLENSYDKQNEPETVYVIMPNPNQTDAATGDGQQETYILVDGDGDLVFDEGTSILDLSRENIYFDENGQLVQESTSASEPVSANVSAINLDHSYAKKKSGTSCDVRDQVWVREEDYKSGVFDASVALHDIGPLLNFSDDVGAFVDNDARLTMDIKERIRPKQVAILADRCGFKNSRQAGDKLQKTKMSQIPTATDLDAMHNYRKQVHM